MVDPWNVTHVLNNPACPDGMGCFIKNINDCAGGWVIPVLMLTGYAIALYAAMRNGASTIKAFIGCTFFLFFMFLIGFLYQVVSEKLLILSFVALVIMGTIKVFTNAE